jgi:hypothetical protein
MTITTTSSIRTLIGIAAAAALLPCRAVGGPIAATGWNSDVIVENTAGVPYSDAASPFDLMFNYGFYQAGLSTGTRGLPASGSFTSLVDGTTVFQFQPYTANNVLLLFPPDPTRVGTLTLTTPQAYSSLSILAAAANSHASQGYLYLHFADGTISPTLQFNNSDWFFQPNPALMGFGRLDLGATKPENNGDSYPELYQTTLDLAALGLASKPIASIYFIDLHSSGFPQESTGIFALSGTAVAEPGSLGLLLVGVALVAVLRRKR